MEENLAVNIPSKLSNSRHNFPWMNRNLKRLIRKKGRRFKKAKKSGMDEDRERYLDIEQMVKRELRDAERVYVNGILQNGLESGNNKPFWKYVKSQKQETFGISALKSNGNVIRDSLSKAEILNSQFKSVFTPQSGKTFPQLLGTQFPKIKPLHISENGVFMLLDKIDVSRVLFELPCGGTVRKRSVKTPTQIMAIFIWTYYKFVTYSMNILWL